MHESVHISFHDREGFTASLDLHKLGNRFQEYEGKGENISEALINLAEQLEEAGI